PKKARCAAYWSARSNPSATSARRPSRSGTTRLTIDAPRFVTAIWIPLSSLPNVYRCATRPSGSSPNAASLTDGTAAKAADVPAHASTAAAERCCMRLLNKPVTVHSVPVIPDNRRQTRLCAILFPCNQLHRPVRTCAPACISAHEAPRHPRCETPPRRFRFSSLIRASSTGCNRANTAAAGIIRDAAGVPGSIMRTVLDAELTEEELARCAAGEPIFLTHPLG